MSTVEPELPCAFFNPFTFFLEGSAPVFGVWLTLGIGQPPFPGARGMTSRLRPFLSELRRRQVYHVAVAYVLVGVGILEAAEVILDPLGLEALRPYLVILVLLGFPIALVLAWAYEVKPESSGPASQKAAEPDPPSSAVDRNGAPAEAERGRMQTAAHDPSALANESTPPDNHPVPDLGSIATSAPPAEGTPTP